MSFIEDLEYIHGDITIFNIGIDYDDRVKIFDIGSAVPNKDEDFEHQLLRDQSNLATCICFLASTINVSAVAKSVANINRIREDLQKGKFPFPAAAKRLHGVIEACWSQKRFNSFKYLKGTVADILEIQTVGKLVPSVAANLSFDSLLVL